MNNPIALLIPYLLIAVSSEIPAQDFEGTYKSSSQFGDFSLILEETSPGTYSGSLTGEGESFSLSGTLGDDALTGAAGDDFGEFLFDVRKNGEKLILTISEMNEDGTPVSETSETLVFDRIASQSMASKLSTERDFVINGTNLSNDQITELEATYGIRPLPGNYWYDARSGLYGAIGYPAYGFMHPDHQFGTMVRDASGGDTGVFVNGRELPVSEYTVWSYMVGSWIQPGAYWLDHQGNAGYEGNPLPVINLYVAAQQNSYNGQGSGGDNFWSTRFSAGNSNADNTQGYVSVPGYGPVGYGF